MFAPSSRFNCEALCLSCCEPVVSAKYFVVANLCCHKYFSNNRGMEVDHTLTLMVRGVDSARTFSDGYFSMKKGVWRLFQPSPALKQHPGAPPY